MPNVGAFCKFVQNYEMLRLILNLLAVIFLFGSCVRPQEKDIISQAEFVKALTEIQLTDSYLNILPIDSARKVMVPLYQVTFDKYGLDSVTFKKNLNYYGKDAEVMAAIYKKVEDNLTKENKFYTDIERRKQDSIRSRDSIIHARIQDSTNRVMRMQQQYQDRISALIHYKPSKDKFSFKDASSWFIQALQVKNGINLDTYMMNQLSVGPSGAASDSTGNTASPTVKPGPLAKDSVTTKKQVEEKPEKRPVKSGEEHILTPPRVIKPATKL